MEIRSAHRKEVSVTDQPDLWKEGQGILLECDGEKWLAEIVMTSKNGWGRPPKLTRWKPGQSGNPKGRPRPKKNQSTFLQETLERKLQIEERGEVRTITALEAICADGSIVALGCTPGTALGAAMSMNVCATRAK